MSSHPPLPPVWVVVLNYNGADHLQYCLPSILATDYPDLTILVVDNASIDASLAVALRYGVRTLCSSKNLGWSGGNNLGILEALAAGARYVALANNDITVHPRWIAEAVAVAEASPDIAVVGFDVHEPHQEDEDRDAGFSEACRRWSSVEVSAPEFAGGMAMLVRMAAIEELGLIDTNFFAYGEEIDFQIRVRKAGYRVVGINVPVWHHGLGSFGATPFRASLLQTENNIQLLLKHGSPADLVRSAGRHVWRRWCSRRTSARDSAVERRLQGSSVAWSVFVLIAAAGRVIWKSPAILRRRAEDHRRVAEARLRRAAAPPAPGDVGASR